MGRQKPGCLPGMHPDRRPSAELELTVPLVSVITPFYNTARYLAECIESVLDQTFRDFEYLLVDNASTDGSLEIAQEYANRDSRIRVVHFDELVPQIPN